jgi:hypothetical protein
MINQSNTTNIQNNVISSIQNSSLSNLTDYSTAQNHNFLGDGFNDFINNPNVVIASGIGFGVLISCIFALKSRCFNRLINDPRNPGSRITLRVPESAKTLINNLVRLTR